MQINHKKLYYQMIPNDEIFMDTYIVYNILICLLMLAF